MLLQYWWKVFGRAVDEVHDFTVCGPRCSDTKGLKRNVFGAPTNARYSICLIKLSAPLKLGYLDMATVLEEWYDLGDDSGAKLLCRFLSSRRLWLKIKSQKRISAPCTAWMITPVCFTKKSPVGSQEKTVQVVLGQKQSNSSCFSLHRQRRRPVDSICGRGNPREERKRRWSKYLIRKDGKICIYYVKVKTRATDRNFVVASAKSLFVEVEREDFKDLMTTYPVCPINGEDSYVVLVNDRGASINSITMKLDRLGFKNQYRTL